MVRDSNQSLLIHVIRDIYITVRTLLSVRPKVNGANHHLLARESVSLVHCGHSWSIFHVDLCHLKSVLIALVC